LHGAPCRNWTGSTRVQAACTAVVLRGHNIIPVVLGTSPGPAIRSLPTGSVIDCALIAVCVRRMGHLVAKPCHGTSKAPAHRRVRGGGSVNRASDSHCNHRANQHQHPSGIILPTTRARARQSHHVARVVRSRACNVELVRPA